MSSLITPDEPNQYLAETVSEVAAPIAARLCSVLGVDDARGADVIFRVVASLVAEILALSYVLSKAEERLRDQTAFLAVLRPQEL